MAIEVIDKIKQKNNGTFALMDAADVEMPDGTRLDNKIKDIDTVSKTTLPEDGIAETGTMYFLGELTELSVGFPVDAKAGDMIFICFASGDTATTLNLATENHIGLSDIIIRANSHYELIGLWDGSTWIFVKNEVVD